MTELLHSGYAAAAHRHARTVSCSPRSRAWAPQFCPSYSSVALPGGNVGGDGGSEGGGALGGVLGEGGDGAMFEQ